MKNTQATWKQNKENFELSSGWQAVRQKHNIPQRLKTPVTFNVNTNGTKM